MYQAIHTCKILIIKYDALATMIEFDTDHNAKGPEFKYGKCEVQS